MNYESEPMKFKLNTKSKKLLADTVTPVSIYLKIRDKFPNSILLESSDYHGQENSLSFICFDSLSEFKVENDQISLTFPDGTLTKTPVKNRLDVVNVLQDFSKS